MSGPAGEGARMDATEPVVRTAAGLVRGRAEDAVAVFRGIPRWRSGDLMRSQWAPFAADGDPGWPPYAPGRRTTSIFDDPPDVTPYPERASLHIWDQHRFGVLDLSPGSA